MISPQMRLWLDRNYGEASWGPRLKDFDDQHIKSLIDKRRPVTKAQLIGILLDEAGEGTEKYAHLLGFQSAGRRQHLIDLINKEKEKMKEV